MKEKLALFFKGMAMGTIDIVPGVSGSTMAVLLGIYERFIAALKNIDLTFFKAIVSPFVHKFSKESRQAAAKVVREADFLWLLNLLLGLATAFVLASFIIPLLMEKYPVVMRGLFFGLVLGSIITPIRSLRTLDWKLFGIIGISAVVCFFVLGQHFQAPVAVTSIVSDGTKSLAQICMEAPCFYTPHDSLMLVENEALRSLVASPDEIVPAGVQLHVQTPYLLYCCAAGFIGICAMLMPGISGSFILLVMGCYYFMLNTGKGFLHALFQGQFLPMNLLYLLGFVVGALAGIAVFSRVLTWLLQHHHKGTLAVIIGVLLGCLRAIWPFKDTVNGVQINTYPTLDISLFPVLIAAACGIGLVVLILYIQSKKVETR